MSLAKLGPIHDVGEQGAAVVDVAQPHDFVEATEQLAKKLVADGAIERDHLRGFLDLRDLFG